MIELFTAPTPNGWKISIMLEECELPYEPRLVRIDLCEKIKPEFLAISPNNRIPAIIDHAPEDGGPPISVFETGAILMYLAEKTGRFLPKDPRGRKAVTEWLFWQVGGLGPMLGQHGHFKLYAPERIDYATDRYRRETDRLYGVLDRRLAESAYIAGPDYSLADMACFPWVQTWRAQQIDLGSYPQVKDWYDRLKQRPGLRRGMDLGRRDLQSRPDPDATVKQTLFGIKETDQ